MFKQTKASQEIAEFMHREMLNTKAEDYTHTSKLNYAVECLNKAAELFDDIGMHKESTAITLYLEKMAGD